MLIFHAGVSGHTECISSQSTTGSIVMEGDIKWHLF